MDEIKITDSNGNEFVINKNYINGEYVVKKIDNGKILEPTGSDLQYVLEELKKKKLEFTNNKYQVALEFLKSRINLGSINSYEINEYINNCDLSNEEKEKLLNECYEELNIQKIIEIREKMITSLRNNNINNLQAQVNFKIIDNMDAKYCEINLGFKNEENYINHVSEVLFYNDSLKKELIEPIILEISQHSKIRNAFFAKTFDYINNRANFYMNTLDNANVNIINTEYEYAEELEKRCEELKRRYDLSNNGDENIRQSQNEYYNESELDNYVTNDDGYVYDTDGNLIGLITENGEINRDPNILANAKGMARTLKKSEKGFIDFSIILIIVWTISILLFGFQMFCLC